ITVSRLVPKNAVDTLIRALAGVRESVPDVRCHILGDGPERQSLEVLARSLGVAQSLTFFGDVPNADVPHHLAQADIFVRPSRSEGMGNAFVEALATGLPIIGTPVGGITDIIRDGETGLFSRVDDPDDLAEKIVRLLTNRALAVKIAAKGRKMVEKRFSWAVIADKFRVLFLRQLRSPECILIVTPQFPPDIGGAGNYASNLAASLRRRGHAVAVLSYGLGGRMQLPDGASLTRVSSRIPSGLKHCIFFIRAWQLARRSDAVVALDPVIVGAPLALACRLRGKPFLLRIEGDFLWEWYSERTGRELTLRQFYERLTGEELSRKERFMLRMARWVFPQAKRLVFSSSWRWDIFKLGYPLRQEQPVLIESPWPRPEPAQGARERLFVFAGRFIRVKNLSRLIRAFLTAAPPDWRLEL
ncbi:MAG: glycosyltransferase, partial [Patescibacteria group bacterium]